MVTLTRRRSAALALLVAVVACQAIIGVDDKQLDPKYSGKPDASTEGAAGDSGAVPSGSDPVPPPRPSGAPTPGGGATRWFAARAMYLGTVDPKTGAKSSTAWRDIGHDIDGECTTVTISKSDSSNTCKRQTGAPPEVLEDGDGCRDNSAGRLLSVGIGALPIDIESQQNANMGAGTTATYLLRLDDLGNGADDPYVRGALYVTIPRDAKLDGVATWNGDDVFNVDELSVGTSTDGGTDSGAPDSGNSDAGKLDGGTTDAGNSDAGGTGLKPLLDEPRFVFDKGYMTSNVWVSGDFRNSPATMPMFVLGRLTVISVPTLTLVVELSAQHDHAVASELSSLVTTDQLQGVFSQIANELVACNSTAHSLLVNGYILPARDIANNPPSFATPNVMCDSESLGFAFRWEPVKPPVAMGPGPSKPLTCTDGG